jgi:hypothetical protein
MKISAVMSLQFFSANAQRNLKLNGISQVQLTEPSPFCQQFGNNALADGQQRTTGNMCVSTVQGVIPDVSKMISTIITQPAFNAQIAVENGFNVQFTTKNLMAGNLADLRNEYLLIPQTVDANTGMIQGFMQVTVQKIPDDGRAPTGTDIVFFDASDTRSNEQGITKFDINIPQGRIKSRGLHRICAMASAASGQPVIMPVAQRGAQGDCIRVQFV